MCLSKILCLTTAKDDRNGTSNYKQSYRQFLCILVGNFCFSLALLLFFPVSFLFLFLQLYPLYIIDHSALIKLINNNTLQSDLMFWCLWMGVKIYIITTLTLHRFNINAPVAAGFPNWRKPIPNQGVPSMVMIQFARVVAIKSNLRWMFVSPLSIDLTSPGFSLLGWILDCFASACLLQALELSRVWV